jgi:beta-lactam-binding protein with PASTA domain
MNLFSPDLKKIIITISIIFGISIVLSFLFLKIYLPYYTNHGDSISVPDLSGYTFSEGVKLLEETGLNFEVSVDSGFQIEKKPLSILKQIPPANSQVKTGRKIYLTLNALNAPMLKMPNLVNTPLKNVQEILANMGLERGTILYVPDIGTNVVLEQQYKGVKIQEGFEIPKGSKIDLVVGDGIGNQLLETPSLIGMDESDAEFLILGSGLKVGEKKMIESSTFPAGEVVIQSPTAGTQVRTGELINFWISKGNL